MAISLAYFDTSVLLKRYVKEDGSATARTLLRRYRFLSSAIAPIEALSALNRRYLTGDLTDRAFLATKARLNKDRGYWQLVEVSPAVLDRAEQVVMTTGLRTLDALHVSSALVIQAASGMTLPFVTADAQQGQAVEALGLPVVWVGLRQE